jgi:hypothetical protein
MELHETRGFAGEEKGAREIRLHDLIHRRDWSEKRMVHRGHPGVVDKHIQPAFLLSDIREHSLDRRLVAHVEAVVPIVWEFAFKRRPAASDDLAATAGVMLD